MAVCTWDPSRHGGKECPVHGSGSGEGPHYKRIHQGKYQGSVDKKNWLDLNKEDYDALESEDEEFDLNEDSDFGEEYRAEKILMDPDEYTPEEVAWAEHISSLNKGENKKNTHHFESSNSGEETSQMNEFSGPDQEGPSFSQEDKMKELVANARKNGQSAQQALDTVSYDLGIEPGTEEFNKLKEIVKDSEKPLSEEESKSLSEEDNKEWRLKPENLAVVQTLQKMGLDTGSMSEEDFEIAKDFVSRFKLNLQNFATLTPFEEEELYGSEKDDFESKNYKLTENEKAAIKETQRRHNEFKKNNPKIPEYQPGDKVKFNDFEGTIIRKADKKDIPENYITIVDDPSEYYEVEYKSLYGKPEKTFVWYGDFK